MMFRALVPATLSLLLLGCGGATTTTETADGSSGTTAGDGTAAAGQGTTASGEGTGANGEGTGANGEGTTASGEGHSGSSGASGSGATSGGTQGTGSSTSGSGAKPAASKPVLAATSYPPGAEPLSDAEDQELKSRCTGLVKHLRKVTSKDNSSRARVERLHRMLKQPPDIPGTNVPRCAELLKRSLVAYRARSMESEAINSIKRIVLGLSMAMSAAKPQLCPSAGNVPAQLNALKGGAQAVPMSAWQQPGWKCARFDTQGMPQRFQYELRTDAAKGSYEIIARGFPVDGQPPVELFLAGEVKDDAIQPSSEVYRRALKR